MHFHVIDRNHWHRKPYFEHYWHHSRCTFSMTANLDITTIRLEVKRQNMKLYPVLLYMLSTVVNRHREFRTCMDSEGRLGYWDWMSPSYTIFHEDDTTFSSIWTLYSEEFHMFYRRYLDDLDRYGSIKGLMTKENEPPNTFPVSSIPWVNFSSFNLNIYNEGTYLLPIFTMGRYKERDGRTLLPLAGQFHHAVCDGYHAGLVYNELQGLADTCEHWLTHY
ncbi:type A chloramphenicol O-acetyltransferase [Paenibacillus guangzhouensis]|uniref:type A chloramphenicol O-acetyltransferase n=1 Tax=Paenibacillus guangzhouensis TaxID=1473112 RepID=UPI001266C766|nr:type A chloramphenicol O-acetyltransferase [Paenibacillus guangzhouensis]